MKARATNPIAATAEASRQRQEVAEKARAIATEAEEADVPAAEQADLRINAAPAAAKVRV